MWAPLRPPRPSPSCFPVLMPLVRGGREKGLSISRAPGTWDRAEIDGTSLREVGEPQSALSDDRVCFADGDLVGELHCQ
jgi:hypothetical protein